MTNSVLKMVLKWKRHFFKLNCNNSTVHLVLDYFIFFLPRRAQVLRNFVYYRFVSKPNVKGQNKWGRTERQDIHEVVEAAV